MRTKLLASAAIAALSMPIAAYAQSTGTVETEIVVTGARTKTVGGFQQADTPKTRGILTQEFIAHQTAGQSVDELINQLPGVSFQNNDAYGAAGGTLTIRGFDASRISQTFDGIPLNDTGNYAIYSNQQLDPELIEQVTVNLGSTDIDSPAASATGSTVNYRTVKPTDQFGVRVEGSAGQWDMMRIFGQVNTGVFTPWGTKLWLAASRQTYNWFANDFGKINKKQYNGYLYQPIGDNGDFIGLAFNWNVNRNNFAGSAPLRTDLTVLSVSGTAPHQTINSSPRTVGTGSSNRFPLSYDELPYDIPHCLTVPGGPGAQTTNACGTSFDERYNPSNTGNIRLTSKFTLAHNLVLTIDPSFQYVKANGGGTVTGLEQSFTSGGQTYQGFIGGSYYFNTDLNGDGDKLDKVTLLAPSQTGTHRYGVISSLRYDINDDNVLRLSYDHDYGRHRQTGEVADLTGNNFVAQVFPINTPLVASSGYVMEKRDRLSFAILDEVAGEYIGKFFDDTLTFDVGLTAKFFKRDLNNFCFTTSSGGFVDCFGRGNDLMNAAYAAQHPYSFNSTTNAVTGYAPPQSRNYSFNKLLPSAGFTFKITPEVILHANYSRGLQVPGTDNLYNAFYFPQGSSQANPAPETSDNFDVGLRYSTPNLAIEVAPWYTRFHNRLASSYDPDTQSTFYRNLGEVNKYGIDGQIDYRPIRQISLHAFGSYLKSEILSNLTLGTCPTTTIGTSASTNYLLTYGCTNAGAPITAWTKGKRESGAPTYEFGGRIEGHFDMVTLGLQAKRTGRRYVNDQNLPVYQTYATGTGPTAVLTSYQVYGAYAPAYTLVDLDARVSLGFLGLNDKTYLQLNVTNLFNEFYVGGYSGGTSATNSTVFGQLGVPRTVSGTINVQF